MFGAVPILTAKDSWHSDGPFTGVVSIWDFRSAEIRIGYFPSSARPDRLLFTRSIVGSPAPYFCEGPPGAAGNNQAWLNHNVPFTPRDASPPPFGTPFNMGPLYIRWLSGGDAYLYSDVAEDVWTNTTGFGSANHIGFYRDGSSPGTSNMILDLTYHPNTTVFERHIMRLAVLP